MSATDTQALARRAGEALRRRDRATFVATARELIAARPNMQTGWKSLAQPLLDFGELDLARRSIDLFVEASHEAPEARFEQAMVYARSGRQRQAIDILDALPRSIPDPAGNAYLRGTIALNLGEAEQAEEALFEALRHRPASGQIFHTLASLGTMARTDRIADAILSAARVMEGAPEAERGVYQYALGIVLDRQGEHGRAFAAFSKGAAIIGRSRPYDYAADAEAARRSTAGWDRAMIDRTGGSVTLPTSDAIIVTGLPRSGSTLTEQILVSHSRVTDGDEAGFFSKLVAEIGGTSAGDLVRWQQNREVDELSGLYMYLLRQRFGDLGRAVDKTLEASRYMGLVASLLPDAPILWMRRDPLDNAWSCFRTYFLLGLPWSWSQEAIAEHFKLEDRLFEHWRALLGDRLMVVDYQALASDKETQIPLILAHCGLAPEATTLTPERTERVVSTSSVAQVRQPISTRAIGAAEPYREYLQPFIDAYGA